jgi:hypothetical protein
VSKLETPEEMARACYGEGGDEIGAINRSVYAKGARADRKAIREALLKMCAQTIDDDPYGQGGMGDTRSAWLRRDDVLALLRGAS